MALTYSTVFHPSAQGIVELMNSVIIQMIRYTINEMNDVKNWVEILPIDELAINSVSNCSAGYSPFFYYKFHPIVPADLIKGVGTIQKEAIQ